MRHVTAAKLYRAFALAAHRGVSLSLHYEESADQWRADVSSAAPSERLNTHSHSFLILMDILDDHLR